MAVRPMHERILGAVFEERRRVASRRGVLIGSARLAGGPLALAFAGASSARGPRVAAAREFESDGEEKHDG